MGFWGSELFGVRNFWVTSATKNGQRTFLGRPEYVKLIVMVALQYSVGLTDLAAVGNILLFTNLTDSAQSRAKVK